MSENTALLQMVDIEKSFPGNYVLKKVNFEVREGEIHGLMGENGAGKSTLIKILTGVYPLDAGKILINGKEVAINSKKDAEANGISVIYQELSVIPTLTVMDNIFLGQELTQGKVFLNRRQMRKRAQQLIEQCKFDIKPDDLVEKLSVAKRQMVEILKAILYDCKLLIMDEPTASLNQQEVRTLFEIIDRLKKNGTSIIYISHRLEEIYELVDRLTILRDGVVAGILEKENIEPVQVIRMMLGKNLQSNEHVMHQPLENASVLKIENLSTELLLDKISFEAYGGQILGISGLVGSGRTETLKCIFGLLKYTEGKITLDGKELPKATSQIIKAGVGYVPEDRRGEGFIPLLDVTGNVALTNYDWMFSSPVVTKNKEEELGQKCVEALSVKPASTKAKCMNLSGGNQQKVVLGKWLQRDLKILLVDEPTVGIDVGAKQQIYDIMRDQADRGTIVIMVSSDLEELQKVADRIVILIGGRKFMELDNDGLTGDDILMAESGIDPLAQREGA